MSKNCNRKNPLARNGTSQVNRAPRALDPAYFQVDERSLSDLVLFAQRYSKHIRYYDGSGKRLDWLPFFSSDITATLAGIGAIPVPLFHSFSNSLRIFLENGASYPKKELANHFKLFFHLPLMLLKQVGEYFERLPRDHGLRGYIKKLVAADLETPLGDMIQHYMGALAELRPDFDDTSLKIVDYNTTFDGNSTIQLPARITEQIHGPDKSRALSGLDISKELIRDVAPDGWGDFYKSVGKADSSPYGSPDDLPYQKIYDALNYNLFITAINRIYQSMLRIVHEAEKYLEESLDSKSDHEPHYGLWLAFLQLFRNNQEHINELTESHLNFYYQDILRICRKSAKPDQVHLLATLTKNSAEHLLKQGLLFKAGKDSNGKEVNYQLDENFVVNRARIDRLQSIFIHKENKGLTPYASAVTNSRNGQGQELLPDNPQWKVFGPVREKPNARIGFAIADRQLFLREGTREITIEVTLSKPVKDVPVPGGFKVLLTSENEWLEVSDYPDLKVSLPSADKLRFLITLDGESPAVIPYNAKIHGENFPTEYAIAKIEFNPENSAFSLFKDLCFKTINLSVVVIGVRNFAMQNENGDVDTGKPFLPFGPAPVKGSFFILGSSELFSKKLNNITLDIEWENQFDRNTNFLVKNAASYLTGLCYLKAGGWREAGKDYDIPILVSAMSDVETTMTYWLPGLSFQFTGTGCEEHKALSYYRSIPLNLPADLSINADQTLENPQYSNKSKTGFIKLALNKGFGHQEYINEKTLALIGKAGGSGFKPDYTRYNYSDEIPLEPYTPKITNMKLGYGSISSEPGRFFHLCPFGYKEEQVSYGRLFPDLPNQGELYIGIKDLKPPQRFSMLFRALEGSSNPLKQENTLKWHYLKGNEWMETEVDDKTDNLSGAGIISIAVPEDADTSHDILPGGCHWLRMSVESDADALCSLLSIDGQAITATFLDQDNALDFQETKLAPGTISKLKESNAAIKKIRQPNESFGGKPGETGTQYYARVSERLRHKDRASSMWDYEHLVLEQFPEIYKVRCINHAKLCRDPDNRIISDNELKPGHVLVVPIPFVSDKTNVDPRRPYLHRKTLAGIDKFLRKRISPFVRLEVQNPKIEEVQVEFNVAFNDNIDDISFYKDQLNTAIISFLTPWAYNGVEISFGGKWHKSSIINFIEEQHYIHYIKEFKMYHKVDIKQEDSDWNRLDSEVVEATTSRSILVSHKEHKIKKISHDKTH